MEAKLNEKGEGSQNDSGKGSTAANTTKGDSKKEEKKLDGKK